MKIKATILFAIIMTVSPPAWAAFISDACSENSQCSSDGRLMCEASNCLEAGKFTITLAWKSDTDLDLSVETPNGGKIGADDNLNADGGHLTIDECYDAERCGESEHPHVEHVVWGFDDATPLGRYRLEVLNYDGRNQADYQIYVTRPDGHRFVLEGEVEASEGAVSKETFVLEATTSCSDRDHDGLCDSWEENGIDFDEDGVVDLDLPALGADPDRKDIFVEVDWMPGAKPYGLSQVVESFADAPVENPDGTKGIKLHIEMSDEIEKLGSKRVEKKHELKDEDLIVAKLGRRDVDEDSTSCEAGWFGSDDDRESESCESIIRAKRQVYRYAVFAYKRHGTTSSGRGELPGDEFIVSTKAWRSNDQQLENATFMHELGHTLGLFHGGFENHNCKPNYLSLMNYFYQTDGTWAGRPLDYSRQKLTTIDETKLIEYDGISGPASWEQVAFQGPTGAVIVTDKDASSSIDWNQNGDLDVDFVAVHVSDGDKCEQTGVARKLQSHDDWSALIYNFRLTDKYGVAWGDEEPVEEMTEEEYESLASASDSDVDGHSNLDDNCPSESNPDQADADEDGVGDVCDRCPDEPAPGYTDGCNPTATSGGNSETTTDSSTEESRRDGSSDESSDGAPTDERTSGDMESPTFLEPESGCSSAGTPTPDAALLGLLIAMFGGRAVTRRRKFRRR